MCPSTIVTNTKTNIVIAVVSNTNVTSRIIAYIDSGEPSCTCSGVGLINSTATIVGNKSRIVSDKIAHINWPTRVVTNIVCHCTETCDPTICLINAKEVTYELSCVTTVDRSSGGITNKLCIILINEVANINICP